MKRKIILMMLCCYMPAEDHALESVQETYSMVRKPSNVKGNWYWKDLTSFMLTPMFWEQLKCMLVLVLLGDFWQWCYIFFSFWFIFLLNTPCVFHVVDILSFVLWISEKKNPHKKLTEKYVDESPRFIRFKTVR